MTKLWFLARTFVDSHWTSARKQCVYGGREKSSESLEMVKKEVEGYFKLQVILWKFWNLWYFTEVLKPMVFNGGFQTHGILRRFWNPWYFTQVLKPIKKGYERGFPRFKKIPWNMFPKDGLAEETAILSKRLNIGFNSG